MYSQNRQIFTRDLLGTRTDNLVLLSLSIEASRTYIIFGLRVYQVVVGTAGTSFDLELDGAVIATVAYANTSGNTIKNSATTFPITITGAAAGSRLQITQNVAEVAATARQVILLDMEAPFRTAP